ncbi:PAS domain S-box [Cylindrospermum stagnale PCC 7417]|uniref:histidine kinase n=1 Tax=Cylindrospermum stagnale PCC 7417 TaxID=56107 RepID=K9WX04_9NOST|nr:PAS domain-containing sensor histidine kinase [Cylindrospermum stagnale]AFZ24326.1 PAS domain S-box [Cylindrospermum stagnale PCC 7417]
MLTEFLNNFFYPGHFIPHGHCYLWKPGLVLLHILSDLLIALAYYSIPIMLVYFVRKRRDVPFDWIFLMFSTFIVACGTTHLMEILTLWYPSYWLSGFLKAITAFVSLGTALALISLLPKALSLPSPAQLATANIALQNEITERKRVEVALRESQQMLQLVIDNIPQFIFWKDKQSVFLGCNRNFAQIAGVSSPENIIGKTDADLAWNKADADFFREYDCQFMGVNAPEYNIVKPLFRADAKPLWLESNKIPLNDTFGDIVGILGTFEDITERRQAEADIYNALEKEKELIELKSRFISTASHEFRTPLTIILSSAELLKNYSHQFSDEKKHKHLQRIQVTVQNMVQLLDDVLFIGKSEAGKQEFKLSLIELVEFCRELVEEIQLSTDKQKILFGCQGEYTIVYMDEKLLRQIIMNLLSNAIKYSHPNSNIHFNLICQQGEAVFQIQDEGIGIPVAEQAQIFTAFQRASNVGTISGTGLGLSIVKKAVDLHGGKIIVESKIGVGTKITVAIPRNYSENHKQWKIKN